MQAIIDSSDRRILLLALTVLVISVGMALFFAPSDIDARPYPSSMSSGSNGAKAAYLLLHELSFDVERWRRSPVHLDDEPSNSTLILVDPFSAATGAEKEAI